MTVTAKKLAVFLPNWVGDAVMCTPALRALREHHADAEIVGIARPPIGEVLAGTDLCDRVLLHHPQGKDPAFRGWRFIQTLRRERFDVAVLFPNSLHSAWLAWCGGARERIGFDRDWRGWLLTTRVPAAPRHVPTPAMAEYLRLVEAAGCMPEDPRLELAVLPQDLARLNNFWRKHPGHFRSRGVICFNTGGAFGAAKNWPMDHFVRLAQHVVDDLHKTVLLVCGPAERQSVREIVVRARRENVLSLADEALSLGLTKAAIQQADLLVTTDSGPRHFGGALGVPVVTLFGPTHIAWSETHTPRSLHLQIPVECGPCQQRECPLKHHRCMTELTVGRVFEAVQQLLHEAVSTERVANDTAWRPRKAG